MGWLLGVALGVAVWGEGRARAPWVDLGSSACTVGLLRMGQLRMSCSARCSVSRTRALRVAARAEGAVQVRCRCCCLLDRHLRIRSSLPVVLKLPHRGSRYTVRSNYRALTTCTYKAPPKIRTFSSQNREGRRGHRRRSAATAVRVRLEHPRRATRPEKSFCQTASLPIHMSQSLALHEAAHEGNRALLETIMNGAANPSVLLEALRQQQNGLSPVEIAMRSGHLDAASQLLSAERWVADEVQHRVGQTNGGMPQGHTAPAAVPPSGGDDPRIIDDASPTCPWDAIQAYAADQEAEAAAQRGPRRTSAIAERYRRYSAWCASRDHTGVDLILATAVWIPADADGPTELGAGVGSLARHALTIALEPNIVPYHLDPGIEHWILWYHPASLPGDSDLDSSLFVPLVRRFLPSLQATDELVAFQNLPQFRSVPQMAHAHIFLRPCTTATAGAVAALRAERRLRSPWAEAERLAGRAAEVGWGAS